MLESEHEVGVGTYLLIFTILMVLTAVTTMVAFVDLGVMNVVIMLAIAATKATLVLLFFMHLKFANRVNWLWVGGAFFWLGVLFLITLSDYLTRNVLS